MKLDPKHSQRKGETRTLKCVLTDRELLEAGADMADAQALISTYEGEVKEIRDSYKAKISEAESRRSIAALKITSGKEARPVKCEKVLDFKQGTATVVRLDTKEIVDIARPLTAQEKQMELPVKPAKKEAKKAVDKDAPKA